MLSNFVNHPSLLRCFLVCGDVFSAAYQYCCKMWLVLVELRHFLEKIRELFLIRCDIFLEKSDVFQKKSDIFLGRSDLSLKRIRIDLRKRLPVFLCEPFVG